MIDKENPWAYVVSMGAVALVAALARELNHVNGAPFRRIWWPAICKAPFWALVGVVAGCALTPLTRDLFAHIGSVILIALLGLRPERLVRFLPLGIVYRDQSSAEEESGTDP